MDNSSLQAILSESATRNFWIKTIGIPGQEPDLHELFTLEKPTVEFSSQPNSIEIDDILIIHRIVVSKVVYVAECKSPAREVTAQEIKEQPFKERWHWTMELHNLTPNYGRHWTEYYVKPFTLVKKYNESYPSNKESLGALQYGSGHLKILPEFGEFLLQKIIEII